MSKSASLLLSEDEYNKLLRKFRLDVLLNRISNEAISIFENPDKNEPPGTKWIQKEKSNINNNQIIIQGFYVTAWGLVDLAYEAVLATHDNRGRETITDDEFYSLVFRSYELQDKRYSQSKNDSSENNTLKLFQYLSGFTGEQFNMQYSKSAFTSATRDLYILLDLSKTDKYIVRFIKNR